MSEEKKSFQKEQDWKEKFVWYDAINDKIEVFGFLRDATVRHLRNNDFYIISTDEKQRELAKDVFIYLGEL